MSYFRTYVQRRTCLIWRLCDVCMFGFGGSPFSGSELEASRIETAGVGTGAVSTRFHRKAVPESAVSNPPVYMLCRWTMLLKARFPERLLGAFFERRLHLEEHSVLRRGVKDVPLGFSHPGTWCVWLRGRLCGSTMGAEPLLGNGEWEQLPARALGVNRPARLTGISFRQMMQNSIRISGLSSYSFAIQGFLFLVSLRDDRRHQWS